VLADAGRQLAITLIASSADRAMPGVPGSCPRRWDSGTKDARRFRHGVCVGHDIILSCACALRKTQYCRPPLYECSERLRPLPPGRLKLALLPVNPNDQSDGQLHARKKTLRRQRRAR
jgi:hypothetical protein